MNEDEIEQYNYEQVNKVLGFLSKYGGKSQESIFF